MEEILHGIFHFLTSIFCLVFFSHQKLLLNDGEGLNRFMEILMVVVAKIYRYCDEFGCSML